MTFEAKSNNSLREAIFVRGGEKLQEDLQLVVQRQEQRQEQQQREEEERAFSEMLERNSEDWESGGDEKQENGE